MVRSGYTLLCTVSILVILSGLYQCTDNCPGVSVVSIITVVYRVLHIRYCNQAVLSFMLKETYKTVLLSYKHFIAVVQLEFESLSHIKSLLK